MRNHRWTSVALGAIGLVGLSVAAPAQQSGLQKAAWYSFDSEDSPGRSVARTPWPGYPFRAEITEGKVGSALAMMGEGANGLLLPNPAAFFGEEARTGTIAFWVKPAFDAGEDEGQRVIIDFMKESGNTRIDGYEVVILTDGGRLAAQAALGRRMSIDSPLSRDRWTHLALTWDSDRGSALYVDGAKAAERTGSFTPTPLTWWPGRLGSHTPGGGYPFKGVIDELRLFNRMLGDEEARQIAQAQDRSVAITASGWGSGTVRVANKGLEAITIWRQSWQAESDTAGRLWGGLPVPEHEFGSEDVYVGGAAGLVDRAPDPVTIPPKQTVAIELQGDEGYCKWTRLRLMVGEGLGCREAAGADLEGLVCWIDPPYLVAQHPATVRLTVRNELGRRYSGVVSGQLLDASGQAILSIPARSVTLKPGANAALPVRVPDGLLRPGLYRLDPQVAAGRGRGCPLRSLDVPVVEHTTYKNLFGVGAAYISHTFGADTLPAMATDRVKVLRRSRSQWLREPEQVEAHGFRMWYMPAYSSRSICLNPSVTEGAERLARSLGACLREKPTVLNQVMLGEGLSRTPCYCDDCNAAFREYLAERYRDMSRLNDAWGSSYDSRRRINQLGSPDDVSEAAERMALMQRELPEAHSSRWRELFRLDPPRAIEWKRWHDGELIDWYRRFARAFHQTNRGQTALSEQPCWPNFKHHVLFALGEIADLGGMDLYLPGELPTTLGYASELFMNFDLNASVFQGKPLWVHELYVQDNSPPLLPEAQGWFLIGRGYSMLTYFTYDYYKEGIRANLPLIFGMFDPDGKPYPAYDSFVRFGKHMEQFHRRYDAFSLRREEPRVAVFLGDDVSLANALETGGETWGAAGVHGHIGAYWLAARNGYPVEFINDERFERLAGKQVLIVPWTHVIRPASIKAILRFAREGGTLILDGPFALYDAGYRPYSPMPGGRAIAGLGVGFGEYRDEPNTIVTGERTEALPVDAGTRIAGRGVPLDVRLTGWEVLAREEHGSPALIRRALGRGQVFWLLTNMGRVHRGRAPAPDALALWRGMLASAGIESRHIIRSVDTAAVQPGAADLDHGGKGVAQGAALCDAAIRLRGDNEAFVFLVSFFDGTEGELLLRLPPGDYEAADALSGEPIPAPRVEGGISLPIDLPPFGSRVVRVRALDGAPFAEW